MTGATRRLLLWTPRIMGVLTCLFLGMFALDAFSGGRSVREALPDFAVHLAPAVGLLVVVGLSWRRQWVGGLVFTGLGLAYAYVARSHPSWILPISGPLLLVGALFLLSWQYHRQLDGGA